MAQPNRTLLICIYDLYGKIHLKDYINYPPEYLKGLRDKANCKGDINEDEIRYYTVPLIEGEPDEVCKLFF